MFLLPDYIKLTVDRCIELFGFLIEVTGWKKKYLEKKKGMKGSLCVREMP